MALSGCSPTTGGEKIKQGINNLKTPSSLQLTLVVAILEIFLPLHQTNFDTISPTPTRYNRIIHKDIEPFTQCVCNK